MNGGEPVSVWAVETSWTLIDAAAGERADEDARQEVLARYYEPACKFLEKLEHDAATARDYAHDFFLQKMFKEEGQGVLEKVDRKRKFRPYLKESLRNYRIDRKRAEARARKRAWAPQEGGDASLDDLAAPKLHRAEAAFDRARVRGLLARAVEVVRASCEEKGEGAYVDIFLARYFHDDDKPPSWRKIGERHGLTEKVARHRSETAARRFGAAIRQVLTEEEGSAAAADEEIASLLEALRSSDDDDNG